ncbi:MAG TPA: hypothetical protein DCS93_19220 [Microscillaceae bacterium]|nr:hypothetical protein [Microscillaceae bacterium]
MRNKYLFSLLKLILIGYISIANTGCSSSNNAANLAPSPNTFACLKEKSEHLKLEATAFSDSITKSYKDTCFKGYVVLKNVTFGGAATFENCTFGNVHEEKNNVPYVDFFKTIFRQNVSFKNARFLGEARFNGVNFQKKVNFENAYFAKKLILRNTIFEGESEISFKNATLPSILDISNLDLKKFKGIIDLTEAKFDANGQKKCTIYLGKTDLSKIKLDFDKFELPDNLSSNKKIETLTKLLEQQKKDGMRKGAIKADIQIRRLATKDIRVLGNLFDLFGNLWWNYSYNKERIFYWTLALFTFFWFYNFVWLEKMFLKVYKIDILVKKYCYSLSKLNPNDHFLVNVTSGGSQLNLFSQPTQDKALKNKYRGTWYFWVTPICRILRIFGFHRDSKNRTNLIKLTVNRWYISFLYTAYIFFGININLQNLNYHNRKWMRMIIYFFFMYISGLISLAYLAGYVIVSK